MPRAGIKSSLIKLSDWNFYDRCFKGFDILVRRFSFLFSTRTKTFIHRISTVTLALWLRVTILEFVNVLVVAALVLTMKNVLSAWILDWNVVCLYMLCNATWRLNKRLPFRGQWKKWSKFGSKRPQQTNYKNSKY